MTETTPMNSAYQGSANGARARTASSTRDWNDVKWESLVVAKLTAPPYRMPPTPARNAEMQKTSTRVVLVDRPIVATAVGDSDSPRNTRPSRERMIPTTTRLTTTTAPRTR